MLVETALVVVEVAGSGKQVQAEEMRLATLPEQASTAYLGKALLSVTMTSVMTEQKAWDS